MDDKHDQNGLEDAPTFPGAPPERATLVGEDGERFTRLLTMHALGLAPVSTLGPAARYGSDGVLEITVDQATLDALELSDGASR